MSSTPDPRFPRDAQPRRAGGREGRRTRPRQSHALRAPYVDRKIGIFRVLDEEGLAIIEHNADTILQEIGMEFRGDPEILEILADAGADVKGERARFERGMCRKIIQATAPREFTFHARNPARSLHFGGASAIFSPAGGSPFVHDMDRGRRYGTLKDFRNLNRIIQSLDALHTAGGHVCEPLDIPVPQRHLHMLYAQLRLTDKAIFGSVTAPERARDTLRMAGIVFGEKFLAENCCIYAGLNTNSPLVFDVTMMGALKEYSRHNQAVLVSPYILAGAMGPVSVAGCLSQLLAEAMGGLVLTQLIRPGAPCVMGTFIGTVSMQSGAPTFGTPESLLGITVGAELGRRLGVPVNCAGGAVTSSKIPDAQAAYESALTLNATFLAGANFLPHTAGWLEGGLAVGYEKMILDADLCTALQTFSQGLELSVDAQALEAIREVGPGSHYMGAAHTQRHFETAFWRSETADSRTFEQWSEEGRLDSASRANAVWKRLLRDYQEPPMDIAVDEALRDYRDRRLAELRNGAAG
ncbi:MAG: trimethylamine methyltransferase family protein [Parvibaculaceae bacterium]